MKEILRLLPLNLQDLLEQSNFEDALKGTFARIEDLKSTPKEDIYQQNRHLSQLYFQLSSIYFSQKDFENAFLNAKKSYQHDSDYLHEHIILIDMCLSYGSEEAQDFACEIALDYFASLKNGHEGNNPFEFHEEGQILPDISLDDLYKILKQYSHLEKIKQCFLECKYLSKRYDIYTIYAHPEPDEELDEDILDEVLALCDTYEKKGLNKLSVDCHRTNILFLFRKYKNVLELWKAKLFDKKNLNRINNISDALAYYRIVLSYIYTGKKFPFEIKLIKENNAELYYDLLSYFMDDFEYICDEDNIFMYAKDSKKLQIKKENIKELVCLIGEHGLSLYEEHFLGKKVVPLANDKHTFAMFCRNYACVLEEFDKQRALELSEKGFALSPFWENAEGMINYPIDLEQYNRAKSNLELVKPLFKEYLNFGQEFYFDSKELFLEVLNGVDRYFEKEQKFKQKYEDFLYLMTLSVLDKDEDNYPQSLEENWDCFEYYLNAINDASYYMHKHFPDNKKAQLYYYEVQLRYTDESDFEWYYENEEKTFKNTDDEHLKERLNQALASLAYVKMEDGAVEENQELLSSGVNMFEELISKSTDSKQVAIWHQMMAFRYLGQFEYEKAYFHFDNSLHYLQMQKDYADIYGFIADPLLSSSYWNRYFTGEDAMDLENEKLLEDLKKAIQLNDAECVKEFLYEMIMFVINRDCYFEDWHEYIIEYIELTYEDYDDEEKRDDAIQSSIEYLKNINENKKAKKISKLYQELA